jgi:hypothetical protein
VPINKAGNQARTRDPRFRRPKALTQPSGRQQDARQRRADRERGGRELIEGHGGEDLEQDEDCGG